MRIYSIVNQENIFLKNQTKSSKIFKKQLHRNDLCDKIISQCRCGGMADATDSKSVGGNFMWVRLPPSAPQALRLTFIVQLLSLLILLRSTSLTLGVYRQAFVLFKVISFQINFSH